MTQTKTTTELNARDSWGGEGDWVCLVDGRLAEVVFKLDLPNDITAILLSDGSTEHSTAGSEWQVASNKEREWHMARRRALQLADELAGLAQIIRDRGLLGVERSVRMQIEAHGVLAPWGAALGAEPNDGYMSTDGGRVLCIAVTGDRDPVVEPPVDLPPPPEWPPPVVASPCVVAERAEGAFRRAGGTGPDRTGCTYDVTCPLHPWAPERDVFPVSDGHRVTPPTDALEFDRHSGGGAVS